MEGSDDMQVMWDSLMLMTSLGHLAAVDEEEICNVQRRKVKHRRQCKSSSRPKACTSRQSTRQTKQLAKGRTHRRVQKSCRKKSTIKKNEEKINVEHLEMPGSPTCEKRIQEVTEGNQHIYIPTLEKDLIG